MHRRSTAVVVSISQTVCTGIGHSIGARPEISNRALKILGQGNLPAAKRVELTRLSSSLGEWIEVNGRVRAAETSGGTNVRQRSDRYRSNEDSVALGQKQTET